MCHNDRNRKQDHCSLLCVKGNSIFSESLQKKVEFKKLFHEPPYMYFFSQVYFVLVKLNVYLCINEL